VDEPGNAELARRLNDIAVLLQQVVGRPEYTADQRLAEHRYTAIERDIEDVRHTHVEDIKAIRDLLDKAAERRGTDWKQAIYNGLLPAVFLAVTLLVTILLAFKGGSGR
jgi:hypothetical protein